MTHLKDMETIEWWHDPDLAFDQTIPEKFKAISIGWIETDQYPKGIVSGKDINRLEILCRKYQIDQGFLGYHTCRICNRFEDRGEVLLRAEERFYVMPHMILHYVRDHQYQPPKQFLENLRRNEALF